MSFIFIKLLNGDSVKYMEEIALLGDSNCLRAFPSPTTGNFKVKETQQWLSQLLFILPEAPPIKLALIPYLELWGSGPQGSLGFWGLPSLNAHEYLLN